MIQFTTIKIKNFGMETTTINKWHSRNVSSTHDKKNFPEYKTYKDRLSGEIMDKPKDN